MDDEENNARLRRECIIHNVETQRFSDKISFVNVMGEASSKIIEGKTMACPRRLHEELVGAGARISREYEKAKIELKNLIDQPCKKSTRVVSRCGWHGDTYVNGHSSYGRDPHIVLDCTDEGLTLGMQKGDLASFNAGIAPLLNRSRIVRLTMAAQCASILSERVGVQEFDISHIYGVSGVYKTLAVSIAAAMIGRARKTDLQTHAHSIPGFERMMAFRRHSLGVLDDIGTSGKSDRDMFHRLEDMAYGSASAQGRTLASKGSDFGTVTQRWSQFVVSTGEKSTLELAGTRKGLQKGARRRLLEFELNEERGGICDIRCKGKLLSPEKQSKVKLSAKEAITDNFGVSLPVFINWILQQEDIEGQYNAVFQSFVESFQPDDGWTEEVVKKLAHKAAAGVMGVRAGVIPVTEKGMVKSMRRLCQEALSNANSHAYDGEVLAKKVVETANNHSHCPFVVKGGSSKAYDPKLSLGFKRKLGGKNILFIPCTKLKTFLGSKAALGEALRFCKDSGLMLLTDSGEIHESVKLPVGKTMRCYRFKWRAMQRHFGIESPSAP